MIARVTKETRQVHAPGDLDALEQLGTGPQTESKKFMLRSKHSIKIDELSPSNRKVIFHTVFMIN